jgi:peptide/nickel transport system permease protein
MNARILRLLPLSGLVLISAVLASTTGVPNHLDLPLSFAGPTGGSWFGHGEAGVDLQAVVPHAILRGTVLALVVAAIGFSLGAPLGAAAALARGRLERVVDRACDLVQSFPSFLLALAVLSAVRSPNRVHLACVFALTAWAPFTRLALAQTRVLRGTAFVEAAQALGATRSRVVLVHVLPNLMGPLAVQLGATASAIVVSEAALSFVGLGPRDGVSLGSVLDQGVYSMLRAPHVLVVGSLAVFVTSLSLLVAGRAAEGTRR